MLAAIAERPAGKVVEVFRSSAERQGAYDLLSNDAVRPDALLASIQQATAMRSSEEPFVYVVVDGTSLRLTDRQLTKDFGAVGSTANAARGLKLVHSYAISPRGVPTGIVDQQWWVRQPRNKRNDCQRRALQDKDESGGGSVVIFGADVRYVVLAGSGYQNALGAFGTVGLSF